MSKKLISKAKWLSLSLMHSLVVYTALDALLVIKTENLSIEKSELTIFIILPCSLLFTLYHEICAASNLAVWRKCPRNVNINIINFSLPMHIMVWVIAWEQICKLSQHQRVFLIDKSLHLSPQVSLNSQWARNCLWNIISRNVVICLCACVFLSLFSFKGSIFTRKGIFLVITVER